MICFRKLALGFNSFSPTLIMGTKVLKNLKSCFICTLSTKGRSSLVIMVCHTFNLPLRDDGVALHLLCLSVTSSNEMVVSQGREKTREKATPSPVGMPDFESDLIQSWKQWEQELYLYLEFTDLSIVRD